MDSNLDDWESFLRAIVNRVALEDPEIDPRELIERFMMSLFDCGRIKKTPDGKYLLPKIDDPAHLVELVRLHKLH